MSPDQLIAIIVRYDKTAAVYMTLVIAASLDFAERRPGHAFLMDQEAATRANVSVNAVEKIKSKLVSDGMITRNKDGSVSASFPRLRALTTEDLPPKRTINKPECRPRTEPEREVVMVRVPGSTGELPINEACSNGGGLGAKCACPLHAISRTRSADSEGVSKTHPYSSMGESGKHPYSSMGDKPSPPPKSEPPPPKGGADSAAVSKADLLAVIVPLCFKLWKMSPETGKLVPDTLKGINATANPRGTLGFLANRIMAAAKKGKGMGILKALPKDAAADYKLWRAAHPEEIQQDNGEARLRELYASLDEDGRADLRKVWAGEIEF